MYQYKIVVEEPPAPASAKRGNSLPDLLVKVHDRHHGKWVRIAKNVKHTGYIFLLKRQKFPTMQITTRKNSDGTSGIWVKFP